MKNIILGDMRGYIANRAWDSDEYRLDTPESELHIVTATHKPASFLVLAALESLVLGFYRNLFSSKAVKESKVRP